MKIYQKNGYLDAAHIEEVADKNGIAFVAIIGKRQIGKTYNVLKHMLDNDRRFIFMRRVRAEMEMLESDVNSPFEAIRDYAGLIKFRHESQYTAAIERLDHIPQDADDKPEAVRIGTGVALSTVGNIRGFNGSLYSDLVFDEFIPEEQLYKVRNEGDAFLNAYTTINGNREIDEEAPRPPLRVWLLANSNNLDSGILDALNITRDVERMSIRGDEVRILPDRHIMILLPDSTAITEKRKRGVLYEAIDKESDFAKMAYENKFSYNDYSDVVAVNLREYNVLAHYGKMTIHLHKNAKRVFVSDRIAGKARHEYRDTEYYQNKFIREFPDLRPAFLSGHVGFSSMRIKAYFIHALRL